MTVTVTVTGTLLSGGALVEVVVVQRHYLALLDEQLVLVATRQLAPAPGIGSGHGGSSSVRVWVGVMVVVVLAFFAGGCCVLGCGCG